MKEIVLSQGKVAIVDDEDYEYLNQWKWSARRDFNAKNYYAVRGQYFGMVNGKPKIKAIQMHRLIMDAPKDKFVDHINHNTLDNRKENLRVVSPRQNMQNLKRKGTSKYPGVYWHKCTHKWEAKLRIGNRTEHLGLFTNERKAAKAYEKAVRELTGEELVCKMKKQVVLN